MAIAERLVWGVEMLDVKPDDHILEIGCGHGVAISLICEKLTGGCITALDRSQTMIDMARKRNSSCDKVGFQTTALAHANFEDEQFDKIFAVHVNVFWQKPAKELRLIKGWLKPVGSLYLFYQPLVAEKTDALAATLKCFLSENGFDRLETIIDERKTGRILCVIAGTSQ